MVAVMEGRYEAAILSHDGLIQGALIQGALIQGALIQGALIQGDLEKMRSRRGDRNLRY
ncbi:MAG: hypothetical protein RQ824_09210 [bacterium]|nr:hypothetical protein [bacterium]